MALVALCLGVPVTARASSGDVAALQVAMRAVHTYHGHIDGIRGPETKRAVRLFQRRRHLRVDGIVGPRTRRAMGRRGRPLLGHRPMHRGERGWDVAALQFMLRRRGFSPHSIDGGFGPATSRAVRRFQRHARIAADGVAGRTTIGRLRHRARRRGGRGGYPRGPVRFLRPVRGPIGDGFGMRWGRPHQGIDFPVPYGRRVDAAGVGRVIFAGYNTGGYGYLVIIRHRRHFTSWYAHLSRITARYGERVVGGTRIGFVGATGHATGPHLHFEVRYRGVPINPMPRLLATAAAASFRRAPTRHQGCDLRGLQRRSHSGRKRLPTNRC